MSLVISLKGPVKVAYLLSVLLIPCGPTTQRGFIDDITSEQTTLDLQKTQFILKLGIGEGERLKAELWVKINYPHKSAPPPPPKKWYQWESNWLYLPSMTLQLWSNSLHWLQMNKHKLQCIMGSAFRTTTDDTLARDFQLLFPFWLLLGFFFLRYRKPTEWPGGNVPRRST